MHDELRAAAFGAATAAPVRVRPGAAPRERWLAAVALGGQGRYAAATTLLDGLLRDPATPRAIAAHAAVTRAAHRRQLGGHAGARFGDGLGLRLAEDALRRAAPVPDADGTDPAAARVDALVGLAADAVGLGVPLTARRLLDSAESACRDHPSWRLPVRVGWVRAELALLRGRPAEAVEPAAAAVAVAEAAGATRHLLKSRIVHAVAGALAGTCTPEEAVVTLDALAVGCTEAGLLPLRWPSELAAADLFGRTGDATNERATRMEQQSAKGATTGAARRRHAALVTMSVIQKRCDPLGRRLLGVSMRSLGQLPVM